MPLFRLIHGIHHETVVVQQEPGKPVVTEDRTYFAGQIIDTDEDLLQYNGAGMTPKFERVQGAIARGAPQVPRRGTSGPPPAQVGGETQQLGPQAEKPPTNKPQAAAAEDDIADEETWDEDEEAAAPPPPRQQGPSPQESGQPTSTQPTQQGGERRTMEEVYGPLEKLTLDQLRDIAREEEVDLKGASRKDDVIRALKAHKTT